MAIVISSSYRYSIYILYFQNHVCFFVLLTYKPVFSDQDPDPAPDPAFYDCCTKFVHQEVLQMAGWLQ
jgi:hypothetical protein